MNRLALYAALLPCLTLSACMNLTTRLQPDNVSVAHTLDGEDCIGIALGIGIGTATVEQAMRTAHLAGQQGFNPPQVPMLKVRTLQFTDYAFLGFGERCIEVTGEGSPVQATAK